MTTAGRLSQKRGVSRRDSCPRRLRSKHLALVVLILLTVVIALKPSSSAEADSGPMTRTDYSSLQAGAYDYLYWHVQSKAPDRVTYVPDPTGEQRIVQHVELRPGDTNVSGSSAGGERAEVMNMGYLSGFVDGQTIVMSWSTYIDSDFASPPGGWNNFVQIHAGGAGQSPWQLNLNGDDAELKMRLYGGGTWNGTTQPAGSIYEWFPLGWLAKNHWHDFVVEVKFGCTGAGSAKVWMDGRQLVNALNRPIGYCGDPGLYWKQGFYRHTYDKTTQLWFGDTFRWVDSADALAHYGWSA